MNDEGGERVDLDGSWLGGIDGALPGIAVFASPVAGTTYRQEWWLGEAEDAATGIDLDANATVRFGRPHPGCLETLDFTPHGPDMEESESYAPGIGPVLETDRDAERFELVTFPWARGATDEAARRTARLRATTARPERPGRRRSPPVRMVPEGILHGRTRMRPMYRPRTAALLALPLLAACGDFDAPEASRAPGAAEARPTARAKNLLWISLDTLRADRLGCYGYERPTSPAIDALARRGLLFEDASTPAPWTAPAHASLFTGLFPQRTGLVGFEHALFENVEHVAERLGRAGFQTLAVVSNPALRLGGLERGFQQFHFVLRDPGPEPSLVTPNARRMLAARDPARPFFALVHYNAVHSPYRAMPRHERKLVGEYERTVTGKSAEFLAHVTGRAPFRAEDVRQLSERYDAAIRQLDGQLERLFAFIEEEGLLADTLVVITSDHGEAFGDHDNVNHAMSQHQELVRVPLILLGPGVPAGERVPAPVSLVDLLPTSLAQLGLPVPQGLDGVDLSPLWGEPRGALAERHLYFQADCEPPEADGVLVPGSRRAIRDARLKLHVDLASGETQLFDLQRDPTEQLDVRASHPEEARALRNSLDAFLERAPEPPRAEPLAPEELRRLQELGYVHGEE